MYGQKATIGSVSTGIAAVSWWMLGVTIVLACIALILLARVFFALRARDTSRRP